MERFSCQLRPVGHREVFMPAIGPVMVMKRFSCQLGPVGHGEVFMPARPG